VYKRVLIPLDGSKTAEGILPFIEQIAGPLDLEVVLLQVVEPLRPMAAEGMMLPPEDVGKRKAEVLAYLRPLASGLVNRGIRTRAAARYGAPVVDQILAEAREANADLIAMATHGRDGLGRVLFGSVAEAVLRHADVPVFLMRLAERPAGTVGVGR
jgi:nucleotide-binding universal stress UspA family protein